MASYDVVIIGSGPGGYVCAIRAAQLGMKVAVVEKRPTFGGTCLNIGCIPSKALLYASLCFERANKQFSKLGIKVSPKLDLGAMMQHKQQTVDANVQGIAFLFKKNKIASYIGVGAISSPGKVVVRGDDDAEVTIDAKNIVVATGSDTAELAGLKIDEQKILSSTGALELTSIPGHLLVVGGGVIGLELGSVWRRLGAKITVVEFLDRILPGMDDELAKRARLLFKRQGIEFKLSTKLTGATISNGKVVASLASANDSDESGSMQQLETDAILVAVGRIPYTKNLGLKQLGVKLDRHGRIEVADDYQTNVSGIYAIGDVIAGAMLAHKAEEEGIAVAENLAGQAGHVNYRVIPAVVYTHPEIASVGASEQELKNQNIDYNKGMFPFAANARARSMAATDGFVKILADKHSDQVLGVHIIGDNASELIHEACVVMEFGGAAEDIARTCHAHPTLAEAMREAALAVDKRAIHI